MFPKFRTTNQNGFWVHQMVGHLLRKSGKVDLCNWFGKKSFNKSQTWMGTSWSIGVGRVIYQKTVLRFFHIKESNLGTYNHRTNQDFHTLGHRAGPLLWVIMTLFTLWNKWSETEIRRTQSKQGFLYQNWPGRPVSGPNGSPAPRLIVKIVLRRSR